MAITTVAQLSAARKLLLPRSNTFGSANTAIVAGLGNAMNPLTLVGSTTPGTPAAGGALLSKASTGFYNFADPDTGESVYLERGRYTLSSTSASSSHRWMDAIWACRSLDGTLTTVQNITGFPAYTRTDSNGVGLMMFLYAYAAAGATATNATITYTNTAGTGGRTSVATVPSSGLSVLGACFVAPLQAGDLGVKSVESVQLSASTGTAGSVGVLLARPVGFEGCAGPEASGDGVDDDWMHTGLGLLDDDAALIPIVYGTAATYGTLELAYG